MKVQRVTMLWIVALGVMVACGGEPRQNVRIILPGEGATFTQGVDIIVFRAELGSLDPTNQGGSGSLWISSLDQVFHSNELEFEIPAESLSVGQHSIVVLAPVAGGEVQDDVTITIQ